MWCFLVLGHCDKIHLRVEGVFCPVSISVPVNNWFKLFLKKIISECNNSARDISALTFCLPRYFDNCTFWLLGLSGTWNFGAGTFWNLGCFGVGTLWHCLSAITSPCQHHWVRKVCVPKCQWRWNVWAKMSLAKMLGSKIILSLLWCFFRKHFNQLLIPIFPPWENDVRIAILYLPSHKEISRRRYPNINH